MDLVEYSQARFEELVEEFEGFAEKLIGIAPLNGNQAAQPSQAAQSSVQPSAYRRDISYIPISALNGDNVVERSQAMAWYDAPGPRRCSSCSSRWRSPMTTPTTDPRASRSSG